MSEKETSERPRFHPILVRNVVEALYAIFVEDRHADKVIEYILRHNPKAGSKDRAFIAENTYEIVRYFRLYAELLGRPAATYADFWQIAAIHWIVNDIQLPDWQEFNGLKTKTIRQQYVQLLGQRKFRESLPDWIDERCEAELGDKWDETAAWLNRPARVVIRANRLKTTRTELQKLLQAENIETETAGSGDALVLEKRQNIFLSTVFKKGLFEVQDYSSQLVAPMLAPEPGMRVVDACAGGGGKALHLSALMQNKGALIALDTFAWKLDALRVRARRAGATNIDARVIDTRKVVKRLYGTADRLLLDVPCSGLGILRRNPDSKWKLTPESIEQLCATQQEILQQYSLITKPGGRMVYATCSILPSENRKQVDTFLASETGKSFKLLEDKSILPQDDGFDGFYIALMERRNVE